MDDKHALKWCYYYAENNFMDRWSKWHWTENGRKTICGIYIPLGITGGSFLPETDDMPEKVTCRKCLKVLKAYRIKR